MTVSRLLFCILGVPAFCTGNMAYPACAPRHLSKGQQPALSTEGADRLRTVLQQKVAACHADTALNFAQAKMFLEAANEAEEAIRHDPNMPIYWSFLATFRNQLNQYDKEESALRELIKLDPRNPKANYFLAEVVERRGDRAEALRLYGVCLEQLEDVPRTKAGRTYHDQRGSAYSVDDLKGKAELKIKSLSNPGSHK